MIAKVILLIVLFVQIFALQFWLTCKSFSDVHYFSAFDVKLKVEEQVHNDVGYSTEIVRYFHNKISLGFMELLKKYLLFWDVNFHALFFSFVGFFGILCGFWYLITSKHKRLYKWVIIGGLALLPLLEVLSVPLPMTVRIGLLWFPFALFSLYGLWQFLRHHKLKGAGIICALVMVSIWYLLALQGDISTIFCYNK